MCVLFFSGERLPTVGLLLDDPQRTEWLAEYSHLFVSGKKHDAPRRDRPTKHTTTVPRVAQGRVTRQGEWALGGTGEKAAQAGPRDLPGCWRLLALITPRCDSATQGGE